MLQAALTTLSLLIICVFIVASAVLVRYLPRLVHFFLKSQLQTILFLSYQRSQTRFKLLNEPFVVLQVKQLIQTLLTLESILRDMFVLLLMLCLLPLDQLEDVQQQGLIDGPCVSRIHTFELLVDILLMNCCIVIDWLGDIVIFAKREKYFAVELNEFFTLSEFRILEAGAKSDEVGDDGVAELIVFSFEEVDDEVEKTIV
jgi:hypothetical protein